MSTAASDCRLQTTLQLQIVIPTTAAIITVKPRTGDHQHKRPPSPLLLLANAHVGEELVQHVLNAHAARKAADLLDGEAQVLPSEVEL